MKVLVGSIIFAPDTGGHGLFSSDLALYLAEQGHEVSVVTGFSYYPEWRKKPGDRRKLFRTEITKDMKIFRGFFYVPKRVTTIKRVLHEFTFLFFGLINFLRAGKQDYVVVFSPPILLGVLAVLFQKLWKCALILNVQDLQTEAALSLGMVKRNWVIRAVEKAEEFLYRRADFVTTISQGMENVLLRKGVDRDKLKLVPNWIDVKTESQRTEKGEFLKNYPQVRDKVAIAYAGNIGIKQGVEVLIDVAEQMASATNIHFFVVGDGADKPRLLDIAMKKQLKNITFLPFMDHLSYRELLEDVDIIFVAQKPGTGNVFFPGKLLGITAMRKPLLVCAEPTSELAQEVAQHTFGLVSTPGDIAGLIENIRILASDPAVSRQLGANGLTWVQSRDRGVVLSRFLDQTGIRQVTEGAIIPNSAQS